MGIPSCFPGGNLLNHPLKGGRSGGPAAGAGIEDVLVLGAGEDFPDPFPEGGGGVGPGAGAGVEDELVDVLVSEVVEDGADRFAFCKGLDCCAPRKSPSSKEVDASVPSFPSEKTQQELPAQIIVQNQKAFPLFIFLQKLFALMDKITRCC
ncbi:MAG: hypothetical protein LBD66_02175 [Holosporales bacterium]|jgi:hypothetical protein|nr:hypothetical protein [Holosporales bacterium]